MKCPPLPLHLLHGHLIFGKQKLFVEGVLLNTRRVVLFLKVNHTLLEGFKKQKKMQKSTFVFMKSPSILCLIFQEDKGSQIIQDKRTQSIPHQSKQPANALSLLHTFVKMRGVLLFVRGILCFGEGLLEFAWLVSWGLLCFPFFFVDFLQ